jgi:ferredoxin|eukprot:g280.t1 g280   contig1:684814-685617(-)
MFSISKATLIFYLSSSVTSPIVSSFSISSSDDVNTRTQWYTSSMSTPLRRRRPPSTLLASSERGTTNQSTSSSLTNIQNEYPVQVLHQGHKATIYVRENEPILQALERQSTSSDKSNDPSDSGCSSLALSNIPNECRRGNCLTCASRIVLQPSNGNNVRTHQNILPNVNNGLSPTVASELTNSGYILTCCSYITGPGVTLEIDQSNEVWDRVYRQRFCDVDAKQVAMEAQARLLRRVDEKNVGKWKKRMRKVLESSDNEEGNDVSAL